MNEDEIEILGEEPSRGRGRPRKTHDEKRTFRVRIGLTRAEYAGLLNARKPGEKPGETAKRLLFYAETE